MKRACAIMLATIALIITVPVLAQGSSEQSVETNKGRVAGSALDQATRCGILRLPKCDKKFAVDRGFFETGLSTRFPENVKCHGKIDEWYAKDLSGRGPRVGEAHHGGIDIPAPFSTPIIAVAAGVVVAKYNAENSIRGIEIILRHSPEETGAPFWVYTQYTHLSEMPGLEIGQRVRMGERIGLTGNSGTGTIAAQAQGKKGARPALHFGVHYSTSGQYAEIRAPFPFEAIVPVDGYWMDPVALFRKAPPFDSASMKALPDAEKQVSVPVMFEDGETLPAKQKIVWPYTCTRT